MIKTNTAAKTEPEAKGGVTWSPLTAIFMVIAAYLGASVIGEVLLATYGQLQGWSEHRIETWLTNSVYAQFSSSLLIYGLMLAIILLFIRSYKVSVRTLGLVRPRFKDIGIAVLGIPVYVLGYVVLLGVVKALVPSLDVNQSQQLGFQPSTSVVALTLTFISLVVLPPLVEELIIRGFLFTSLLKRFRFLWAALLTSVVFASGHLQFGSGAPLLWVAAIDTFMLSLVLCFMRYKTGSLWPGIFLHALKNGVAFLSLFVFHLV
jgi:membrane protease YdiL (CAAX protease family)